MVFNVANPNSSKKEPRWMEPLLGWLYIVLPQLRTVAYRRRYSAAEAVQRYKL